MATKTEPTIELIDYNDILNTLHNIEKDYYSSHIFNISVLFIDLITVMNKDKENKCFVTNVNILEIEYFKIHYIIALLYKESNKENKKLNSLIYGLLDNISN
jgi:hypothetical protein